MRFLIIEDEARSANRLERLILAIDPGHVIVAKLESVQQALDFFSQKQSLDLILSDIHLGDGLCFEIFETNKISIPVIFTTSYDQYALQAFKSNGIDYLLKPISQEELQHSIEKAVSLGVGVGNKVEELAALIRGGKKKYKARFLIRHTDKLTSVPIHEISCFFSMQKATFIQTPSGRTFDLDQSLDQLMEILDPNQFHRVSRQYIVALDHLGEMSAYGNSRLKLEVSGHDETIVVARERVQGFKSWLSD